jgi:phage terminase small subunit
MSKERPSPRPTRTGTAKSSQRTEKRNHGGKPKTPDRSPGSNKNSAPPHLRPDTAAWWQTVSADYALEQHQLRILTLAAEAWDRCTEAREALAAHGTTYTDRFQQPRARPEISIERDSRIAFARLVRELALDLDPPDEPGRPPRAGDATAKKTTVTGWDDDDRRILGLN